ncbi:MAG: beta-class carbonic anhydrase [Lachnospiraceae bacterium]
MIEEILEYNRSFVDNKLYQAFETSKYPEKKLAILTCMDTRLTELLPAALGIHNGDVKIIKNAGGVIKHPYGSVVRSLLVAILEHGVEGIMVIGHTDCGVRGMDGKALLQKIQERQIPAEHIEIIRKSGINLEEWLGGFPSCEDSVNNTVEMLQNHPLMPKDIIIKGFIIDSATGELTEV